jgi:hypothetical protein
MLRLTATCALLLVLYGCASRPLTAPPEAFLSLGPISERKVEASPEGETARNIEEELEACRKKFRENNRQLCNLSWNSRIRYRLPGSFTLHLLFRATSDENGDVQVREVNRRMEPTQGVTRVADAVVATEADFTLAATLGALSRAYTFPQPGAMERLIQVENLGAETGAGELFLRQSGFLMPEDSVELIAVGGVGEPESMTFQSLVEGRSVEGKVKFRKLPDGNFYPATVDIAVPDSSATVLVENFGFRMQPGVQQSQQDLLTPGE